MPQLGSSYPSCIALTPTLVLPSPWLWCYGNTQAATDLLASLENLIESHTRVVLAIFGTKVDRVKLLLNWFWNSLD
jgi:hypothetical protein